MIFGTIGTVLIAIVGLKTLKENDTNGYLLTFLGFVLTIGYINYLEKKMGLSKKLTWIRSIASLMLLIGISYFFFF